MGLEKLDGRAKVGPQRRVNNQQKLFISPQGLESVPLRQRKLFLSPQGLESVPLVDNENFFPHRDSRACELTTP